MEEFDPRYIFDLHEIGDEEETRRLIRVRGAVHILSELVNGIIEIKDYNSFRGAFFNYYDLRRCFLGQKYVTSTLQIRGVYAIPIETLRRILSLYIKLFDQNESFCKEICKRVLENCEFVAGPGGNSVRLPVGMTLELAFLCGILHGDGGIDKEKIVISHGLSYGKRTEEQRKSDMKLVESDLKMVSDVFMDIFRKDVFSLFCSSDAYRGIVVTSKPVIRFFNKVLQHPIGPKNYDAGIWNKDKLVIPDLIKRCEDKSIIKAYLCGLISTDGTVLKPRNGKFRGVSLCGISEIVHDAGKLVADQFGAKVYFCKRKSKSRGIESVDRLGNYIYRHEIILPQEDFVKSVFDFPFAYPSKKSKVFANYLK